MQKTDFVGPARPNSGNTNQPQLTKLKAKVGWLGLMVVLGWAWVVIISQIELRLASNLTQPTQVPLCGNAKNQFNYIFFSQKFKSTKTFALAKKDRFFFFRGHVCITLESHILIIFIFLVFIPIIWKMIFFISFFSLHFCLFLFSPSFVEEISMVVLTQQDQSWGAPATQTQVPRDIS